MAAEKKSAPTLEDVARESGVSLKTASRVLNGSLQVRPDKVARIQAVMSRLGYRPNELARGLKAKRSSAIGMIVPRLSDPFYASIIEAVQQVARENGYVVIVTSSADDQALERPEISTLVRRQVDGLIIATANGKHDNFSDILPEGLQVITIDEPIRGTTYDSVTVTNKRSAREATQHMIDHGDRRIVAVVSRPYLRTCAERLFGYTDAMKQAGLEPQHCVVDHESSIERNRALRDICADPKVEGIFTLNWVCTMLVLHGLKQAKKKIGKDIRLISFDDFELAEMLSPSLTVVRQPAIELGREAARLLLGRLNGDESEKPHRVVLPTQLVLRNSCGCHSR
jgi:LacI family transcriptional regulator